MNTGNASSASSSATTSGSGQSSSNNPPDQEAPSPSTPAAELSESEFLAQQAAAAKAALSRAFSEAASRLAQGGDPRLWAKEHPWITMGTAAVAGFAAAAAVVPSKEQQALRKLAAIERALNAHIDHKDGPSSNGHENGEDHKPGKGGFLLMVLHEVIAAIRPAIISLLTAGVTAHAAKPSEEDMENAAAREQVRDNSGVGGMPPRS